MVKDGWVYCPICSNKTRTKIRLDTEARNLPVFCPKCKNISIMDVNDFEVQLSESTLPTPIMFDNMKRTVN